MTIKPVHCRHSAMVNELELAVHGTSCSYNAKNDIRHNGKGYSAVSSLYFANVEPDLTEAAVAKKSDQNVADSPGAESDNNQDTSATNKKGSDSKQPSANEEYKPKVTLAGHVEPTYYIGGGNGNAIIEEVMNDLGWRRTRDKLDENYTMKWCELKQAINYNTFKETEQMVNHIPNCSLLTNKLGLLNTLQEYDRVYGSIKKRVPKLDFIPETYKLDDSKERELFKEKWKEGEVWICKPTGRNQGKGIFLVKDKEEVDQLVQESDERNQQQQQGKIHRPINRIIQRYIHNPLLLNNKKFDIRAYMLVASTSPYLVLYHKGYIRLSMFEYENKYENLAMHLTNQFIQKKDPKYKEVKEDTVWSMERFNDYMNETVVPEKGIEEDWAKKVLPTKMKQIMTYCFNAVKNKFHRKIGYFDLYGFDFMIDTDMKVWLIEVNVNPSLATNCEMLREVVPSVVKETLYIVIDCFEKARRGKPIMPSQAIKEFEVLFYEGNSGAKSSMRGGSPGRQPQRSRSISPVRRPHTISPNKELVSRTTENTSQSKRGFVAARPSMKPIPTSTFPYTAKVAGSMGNAQVGNSGTRLSTSLALSKTVYTQERVPSTRNPLKTSSEKLQSSSAAEKQEGRPSAKTNNEQRTNSNDQRKFLKPEEKQSRQNGEQSKTATFTSKTTTTTEKGKGQGQNPNSSQKLSKTTKVTSETVTKAEEGKPTDSISATTQRSGGKQANGNGNKHSADISDKSIKEGQKARHLPTDTSKVIEEGRKSLNTDSSVSTKVIHAHGSSLKKAPRSTSMDEKASRGS